MRLVDVSNQTKLFSRSSDCIWTDPWIARSMLKAHLDESTDAASRPPATIDRTVDWLVSFLPEGARVLDLGCGPGLYAERLTRRGFRVTGIDVNAASIDYARASAKRNDLHIDYRLGSYLELDLGGPYDAAICVYCDIGALTDGERDALFSRVLPVLAPGGLFAFDVFGPGIDPRHITGKNWRMGEGGDFWSERPYLLLEERTRFPASRALGTRYVLVDAGSASGAWTPIGSVKEFTIWDRFYDEEELRSLMKAAGFTVERIVTDLVQKNDFTSEDVLFVAARRM